MQTDRNAQRMTRLVGQMAGFLPAAHYAVFGGIGAVVALAPEASAAPIQSSVVNLVVPTTTAGIYINVVTGVTNVAPASVPGWDINPFSTAGFSFFNPASPVGGVYMQYPGGPTTPGALDSGQIVDGSAAFGSGAAAFGAGAGQWDLNASNFFGFRFLDEGDGQVHYGWGTVVFGASIGTRSIGELWYESQAGAGITVGDTGNVPEPSTALLIAGGAAGLVALRRRRQQSR